MRVTYIAAVLSALAACGGGDGLSLTEPGQVPPCDVATGAFEFAGVWQVEEWGCYGRSSASGVAGDCDPNSLTWTSTPEIAVTAAGADAFRIVIDGITIDAMQDGINLGGFVSAGNSLSLNGCADGSVYVLAGYSAGAELETFAAYAHRR